jgi:hypothetical protein
MCPGGEFKAFTTRIANMPSFVSLILMGPWLAWIVNSQWIVRERSLLRYQVKLRPQPAGVRAALYLIKFAKHRATKRGERVTTPLREFSFTPEIESIDVAVSEVHRPLVRFAPILAGNVGHHGEAARDDGAFGTA